MLKEQDITMTGYIYKIENTINHHVYIGQTRLKNPVIRWKEHFDSAFYQKDKTYNYHLYKAIRKYGIDKFVFQILETNIPIELLDEKEKQYIIEYNSFNDGYNNTIGGQDEEHCHKLSINQVLEIIEKIKKNQSFASIAKEYDIGNSAISDINRGDTWHFDNIEYPIIDKNNKRNFTEQEIQNIYSLLRQGYGLQYIGDQFGVSKTTISNINKGIIYKHIDIQYPIYKAINSVKRLETNDIKDIIYLLKNTNLNYTQIANKLNIGRKTVSNIDQGKGYQDIVQQLGYTIFPIRTKV